MMRALTGIVILMEIYKDDGGKFDIIHNSRNSRILLFSALVDFKMYMFLLRMEILLIGRMTIATLVKALFTSIYSISITLRLLTKMLLNSPFFKESSV